ncbi:glycosyltransferase [Vibrio splendidus]|uniref:glycosyltransferase n=1 Tax=Vibrio splendidus TaxID=29497 RepID=UPI002236926C|nr:glycosyltransferase [Vibrio splendidus]MCW4446359.1 glycosyltransferase [Vibrio splendidus]
MNVIQLLDKYKFGGGERVALTYRSTLNEITVNNKILAYKDDRTADDNVYLSNSLFEYIKTLFSFVLSSSDSVVLMAHTNKSLVISCFFKVMFLSKIKVVYIQHLNYDDKRYFMLSNLQVFISKYIQITPVTKNKLEGLIRKDKVFYFNNYIKLDTYSNSEGEVAVDVLRSINGRKVITFVGVFREGKNVSHITELIKSLESKDYYFFIVGDGVEKDEIDSVIGYENVHYAGYQLNPIKYLEKTDYLFFPSYEGGDKFGEMMPMTILEALEVGCRVISYDLTVNKYLLPKENVFEYMNFEEITNAIKEDSIKKIENIYGKKYGSVNMKALLNEVCK